MSELKTEHLVYMSDEIYMPIPYKGMVVKQPFYQGKGEHSAAQLEALCEQFREYVHQQQVIKQNCMKHIVELKFGVKIMKIDAVVNPITKEVIVKDTNEVQQSIFFSELDEWYGLIDENGNKIDIHFHYDGEFSLSIYLNENYSENVGKIKVVLTEKDFKL